MIFNRFVLYFKPPISLRSLILLPLYSLLLFSTSSLQAHNAVKIFIEKIKCWLATNNEIPFTPNERGEIPELGIGVSIAHYLILHHILLLLSDNSNQRFYEALLSP